MPRAVIVVGNELRFLRAAENFKAYLISIGTDPIRVIRAAYRSADQLERELSFQMLVAVGQPLLLAYFGHGLRAGWAHAMESPAESICLGYDRLGPMLAKRKAPTVFVNECCYAAAVIAAVEEAGADPSRLSIIAASPANQTSYPGMADRLLESWRAGRVHAPFMETTPLFPKTSWLVWLRMWWFRRKQGLKARLFPKRYPLPPPPPTRTPVCEVRWGAPLDHLFFKKP
ncbi:MAG TPA: hypothetical protein VL500_05030 [Candidatus Eisenbacteria bacterium]|nr:hypothetical protein [Candidatus Eisenbacteria bacterium]